MGELAEKYYANLFADPNPNRKRQIALAREVFGLHDYSDQRMRTIVRQLGANFYDHTGVQQSPVAKTNQEYLRDYVDSLARVEEALLDESA